MTKDELAYWQSRIKNSRFKWTEDEIFRLNGRGAFYYHGGDEGIYMRIQKDGLIEAGTYKDAFPHIGDASLYVEVKRQCADYNEAFTLAMQAGGKQFMLDMFSADYVPPPAPTEKPSVINQIKVSRETQTAPRDKLLSFDDFIKKCRMMDEACRQWCDFIDEAPERRDGVSFTEFYEDICLQKYDEYLNDPSYRDDCNLAAESYDQKKAAKKDVPGNIKSDEKQQEL